MAASFCAAASVSLLATRRKQWKSRKIPRSLRNGLRRCRGNHAKHYKADKNIPAEFSDLIVRVFRQVQIQCPAYFEDFSPRCLCPVSYPSPAETNQLPSRPLVFWPMQSSTNRRVIEFDGEFAIIRAHLGTFFAAFFCLRRDINQTSPAIAGLVKYLRCNLFGCLHHGRRVGGRRGPRPRPLRPGARCRPCSSSGELDSWRWDATRRGWAGAFRQCSAGVTAAPTIRVSSRPSSVSAFSILTPLRSEHALWPETTPPKWRSGLGGLLFRSIQQNKSGQWRRAATGGWITQ